MSKDASKDQQLEIVRSLMNRIIRFNQYLGLEIVSMQSDDEHGGKTTIRVPFREEYQGDPRKKIVHGGIISTLIDVTGGATTFCSLDLLRVAGVNTIDMRVDYLRPGRGEWFEGRGTVLRKGNRIVVTHVDVFNSAEVLIAVGTASYNVVLRDEPDAARQEWGEIIERSDGAQG